MKKQNRFIKCPTSVPSAFIENLTRHTCTARMELCKIACLVTWTSEALKLTPQPLLWRHSVHTPACPGPATVLGGGTHSDDVTVLVYGCLVVLSGSRQVPDPPPKVAGLAGGGTDEQLYTSTVYIQCVQFVQSGCTACTGARTPIPHRSPVTLHENTPTKLT